MEKNIFQTISKDLSWYQIILIKLFKKTFESVFHNTRIMLVNHELDKQNAWCEYLKSNGLEQIIRHVN